MKGIFYNRHGQWRENWEETLRRPEAGEEIIVNGFYFRKNFSGVEIFSAITFAGCYCGRYGRRGWTGTEHSVPCPECEEQYSAVKLVFGNESQFTAEWLNREATHGVGRFSWDWSGSGAVEHWFDDEAVCFQEVSSYISNTGLTASASRAVAFQRKVEVRSFRGDCGETPDRSSVREPGVILAEFKNAPQEYRANWTGRAIGDWAGIPVVGDDLDRMIEFILSTVASPEDLPATITACRHLPSMQAYIISRDPEAVSRMLCWACRTRGVRWEEFLNRNQADMCPYFRRAVKSVLERSEDLPSWFEWKGNNLLSTQRRMEDGEWLVYEATFIRRRDSFVRRAVLLLDSSTREAWIYPYNGYIPRTLTEFTEKYTQSQRRQLQGTVAN